MFAQSRADRCDEALGAELALQAAHFQAQPELPGQHVAEQEAHRAIAVLDVPRLRMMTGDEPPQAAAGNDRYAERRANSHVPQIFEMDGCDTAKNRR